MAITIIYNVPALASVFNLNSVQFKLNTGVAPIFKINTVQFTPVFVETISSEDYYTIDVSDILKYFVTVPYLPTSALFTTATITIEGSGLTTVTTSHVLSVGYNDLKETNTILELLDHGKRNNTTYFHSGKISFYNNNAAGAIDLTIGGVTKSYTLVTGLNTVTLHADQNINGTLTGANIDIDLIYIAPKVGYVEVQWLDRDGLWSFAYMRKLNTTFESKIKKQLPNYSYQTLLSFNRTTQIEKVAAVDLDLIAYNTDHYKWLVRISESLVIYYDAAVYRVKQNSNSFAECKQNLHFTLTLETEDYAPNF